MQVLTGAMSVLALLDNLVRLPLNYSSLWKQRAPAPTTFRAFQQLQYSMIDRQDFLDEFTTGASALNQISGKTLFRIFGSRWRQQLPPATGYRRTVAGTPGAEPKHLVARLLAPVRLAQPGMAAQ